MMAIVRVLLVSCSVLAASPAVAWDSTRLSVPVKVNGQLVPYPVFSIFVMPGSRITAGLAESSGSATVALAGRAMVAGAGSITASKQPGLEILSIHNETSGETCSINVFTLVPATGVGKDGRLNGYRIDRYPGEPLRGLDIYLPPQGFVEVTKEKLEIAISPNFKLGEFVSKQSSGYPKYLVLRSSLLLKLENILARLNDAGHPTGGFVIMSGYRTPFYNRAIGNVQYSRHVWGGAADFYIDEAPADGQMDDLNKDGRISQDDARWLASFINDVSQRGGFGPRIGGIGVYGSTSAHGPFVHVDVRGTRARW